MPKLSHDLQQLIQPLIESLGCEFWGGYYSGQSGGLLRILIDKEGGVSVDDCQRVSRQLSALFDVENVISQQYTLEVSSPGVDRPLFTLAQFERFIGHEVRIQLLIPEDGQSRFVGKIMNVTDEKVILATANQPLVLPFSQIEKANLR